MLLKVNFSEKHIKLKLIANQVVMPDWYCSLDKVNYITIIALHCVLDKTFKLDKTAKVRRADLPV